MMAINKQQKSPSQTSEPGIDKGSIQDQEDYKDDIENDNHFGKASPSLDGEPQISELMFKKTDNSLAANLKLLN